MRPFRRCLPLVFDGWGTESESRSTTPGTPEPTEFSRPEYWSGQPFPFSRGSSQPRDRTRDWVLSSKALETRGWPGGWRERGEERGKRKTRAPPDMQAREPMFVSVRPRHHSCCFTVPLAVGPGPQGGCAAATSPPGSGPLSPPLQAGVCCSLLPVSMNHQESPPALWKGREKLGTHRTLRPGVRGSPSAWRR